MANCNFDWSICETCVNAGTTLCPLENNRTIKKLRNRVRELEEKVEELENEVESR